MNQRSNVYCINTLDTQRYLTKKGINAMNKESSKWDIIRVFHWMHQYSSSGSELDSGDYFYGPSFKGDGLKPNIFKFTICGWECKFEQLQYNESNSQKARKDVKIADFGWFKAPTGEYFFACWNTKKIEPLSLYWTREGINTLITKRALYEKMLKNKQLYSDSQRYQLCRIPVSKLYFS